MSHADLAAMLSDIRLCQRSVAIAVRLQAACRFSCRHWHPGYLEMGVEPIILHRIAAIGPAAWTSAATVGAGN